MMFKKRSQKKKFPFDPIFFFCRIPKLFFFGTLRQSTPLGRFRGGRATQKVDQTKPHVRKCPGMSRSQAGPQGPAVTEGGECYHIMFAGADPHTVRHRWQPHTDRTRPDKSGLRLFTDRQDSSVKGGWTKPSVACFPAFELTLSKKAKEKAHEVMHAKRESQEEGRSAKARQQNRQRDELPRPTVIMDTGVDPVGVDGRVDGRRTKREIKFPRKSSVCSMQRVTGTQFGDSFCGST